MFVCVSWSWSLHLGHRDRKNFLSLFQSKMLLPTVLSLKRMLPQHQAVTVATFSLPKFVVLWQQLSFDL